LVVLDLFDVIQHRVINSQDVACPKLKDALVKVKGSLKRNPEVRTNVLAPKKQLFLELQLFLVCFIEDTVQLQVGVEESHQLRL